MTDREMTIRENYLRVADRINEAAAKRDSSMKEDVSLLAATKTVPAGEIVFAAKELGLKFAGENKTTEFTEKYDAVAGLLEYHFIGHLQTNKINKIIGRTPLIHSVGSSHLADALNRAAENRNIKQNVLLEINCADEESKSGFSFEEAKTVIDEFAQFSFLNLCGIMTMGPQNAEKAVIEKYFSKTYAFFIDNLVKKRHNIYRPILSMGMSDSFESAIMCGSTMVRVGSAIFGRRA